MTTTHFRVSNSLDYLRREVKGNLDDYSNNPDLLVLRKLIQEESDPLSSYCSTHSNEYATRQSGSGYFSAPPVPSQLSVDRMGAPGHWAAEARSSNMRGTRTQPQVLRTRTLYVCMCMCMCARACERGCVRA